MKKRMKFAFLAGLLALGTALAGCGNSASNTASNNSGEAAPPANSGSGSGSEASAGEKAGGKIVIASIGPLSGPNSAYGETAKEGAEYALSNRKEDFKKLGFDLELLPQDDQADPKQAVAAAEAAITNKDVLAVVGHVTTGAAISASVKYDQEGLAMVAPSATGIQLTEEGKKVVFRVCARDDAQGSQAAVYAKNQLNVKKLFVLHDKQAYGQGLAEQVKAQVEKDGGVELVGYEGITAGEKDYSAIVNQIVAKKPDLVYFGGYYAEGGILIKQLREKGYEGGFMGADGLDSDEMVKIAGKAADGVIYTSTVGDVSATEEGKKWVEEFEKNTGKKVGIFTSLGYDAMNTVLHGVEEAIKANNGNKPTREQVVEALKKVNDFQGKFMKVGFDEKGDNSFAQVFVYKFENGQKVYVGQVQQ
ncbi:branched-chain amino acid ABC transporter substrate-binding protein [Brevibacillus massiliensis]|uniref:branched-chain amino acid ABC transporter substrate-binding protein n=1 Tax=Brevibacillus massiliensis TaxID=1118054 RepID=UPI000306EF57|nr:branched-chain amino acid ABC transporter substrate-binding protein [Brevibacillus massiliensis]